MPSVSRERIAQIDDYGVVGDRHEDVDGTTIQFVTIREDVDSSPLLRGLPDDRCPCPHWGYVFTGRLAFRFGDREETYVAGEAFSTPPGHVPSDEPGTEYLQFSPAEELPRVSETIRRNMQAMQHERAVVDAVARLLHVSLPELSAADEPGSV